MSLGDVPVVSGGGGLTCCHALGAFPFSSLLLPRVRLTPRAGSAVRAGGEQGDSVRMELSCLGMLSTVLLMDWGTAMTLLHLSKIQEIMQDYSVMQDQVLITVSLSDDCPKKFTSV